MKVEYITIEEEVFCEISEKKSRFIATVKPVEKEEEALEFLKRIRTEYWDASHNVYAYILNDNNISRFSDDGEPAGTAGLPILEIIKKMNLTNVIVVVTRYFGGTLLGTGGLIRAYSRAASEAVQKAEKIKMQLCTEVNIIVDYSHLSKLKSEIEKLQIITKNEEYSDTVSLELYVHVDILDIFTKNIIEKTSGQIKINVIENKNRYCKVKV